MAARVLSRAAGRVGVRLPMQGSSGRRVAHRRAASRAAVPRGGASAAASSSPPHVSVMLEEVLGAFHGRELRTFVDCTLGAGGHSSAVAAAHAELATLVGLDVDPTAHAIAAPRIRAAAGNGDLRVELQLSNFARLAEACEAAGVGARSGADGVLLDLGVSSMQLDDRSRGFSFLAPDERADMRMDPSSALDAAALVNTWSEEDIGRVLREYGEERRWRRMAASVVRARERQTVETVGDLIRALGLPLERRRGVDKIHPATRAFQAIRIAVNGELDVLRSVLPQAVHALAPGGRLAVISFHSLEDRMVKRCFREAAAQARAPSKAEVAAGLAFERERDEKWAALLGEDLPPMRLVNRKARAPSKGESEDNRRARSAKLRVIERAELT